MNTVESITNYLYADDINQSKLSIIKELLLIHDQEINELRDIVKRQSSDIYELKLQLKNSKRL